MYVHLLVVFIAVLLICSYLHIYNCRYIHTQFIFLHVQICLTVDRGPKRHINRRVLQGGYQKSSFVGSMCLSCLLGPLGQELKLLILNWIIIHSWYNPYSMHFRMVLHLTVVNDEPQPWWRGSPAFPRTDSGMGSPCSGFFRPTWHWLKKGRGSSGRCFLWSSGRKQAIWTYIIQMYSSVYIHTCICVYIYKHMYTCRGTRVHGIVLETWFNHGPTCRPSPKQLLGCCVTPGEKSVYLLGLIVM